MSDPITLTADGPHSPEYTKQVGDLAAEAVRVLNYATRSDAGGLANPADAGDLLGALCETASRLPQLCSHIQKFLASRLAAGTVGGDGGRDPARMVAGAVAQLRDAELIAADLASSLEYAQASISGLHAVESPGA